MEEQKLITNKSTEDNAMGIKLAVNRIEASVAMFYPGTYFDTETKLRRMVADIMHFAKKKDCDLPMILRGASMQFITEFNLSQISCGEDTVRS